METAHHIVYNGKLYRVIDTGDVLGDLAPVIVLEPECDSYAYLDWSEDDEQGISQLHCVCGEVDCVHQKVYSIYFKHYIYEDPYTF